jgi:hypothetical protein
VVGEGLKRLELLVVIIFDYDVPNDDVTNVKHAKDSLKAP